MALFVVALYNAISLPFGDSLFFQIVPVIPFALSTRAGVPEADGGPGRCRPFT